MAMTAADRAVIRRWYGSVFDEAVVDEALERLESPYAVALELLMVRSADLAAEAMKTRAGGRSVDSSANLAATKAKIGELLGYIEAEDVSLTSAGQDLVDEAAGESTAGTMIISTAAANPRFGG